MTVIPPTMIVVSPPGRCGSDASKHSRQPPALRFARTYANVKKSDIGNSNKELGADPASRLTTPDLPPSHRLRRGAVVSSGLIVAVLAGTRGSVLALLCAPAVVFAQIAVPQPTRLSVDATAGATQRAEESVAFCSRRAAA